MEAKGGRMIDEPLGSTAATMTPGRVRFGPGVVDSLRNCSKASKFAMMVA